MPHITDDTTSLNKAENSILDLNKNGADLQGAIS